MNNSTVKLKILARKFIDSGQYEKALAAINAGAALLYAHNQEFTDDDMEEWLCEIADKTFGEKSISWVKRSKHDIDSTRRIILYYDGFGLDTRGLTITFTRTLVLLGYKLIYVTCDEAIDSQPELHNALKDYDVEWLYYGKKCSYLDTANQLVDIFNEVRPDTAFFYTTPNDVAGFIAFRHYEYIVSRYLIDLTDHAFWLGINAVDYVLSGRETGVRICYNLRRISEKKILPIVIDPPYTDFMAEFEGFPFNDEHAPYIFSGGALYKTMGDDEKKFYQIVRSILKKDKDVLFWYAGEGDTTELFRVRDEYPERVFYTHERKDFIQIMKRCKLYLNTYPFLGGLMTRYAISLGKIPLTLKHNEDNKGMARNQKEIRIEYESVEELVNDAVQLIQDENYLKDREKLLVKGETSQGEYCEMIQMAIENEKTYVKLIKTSIDITDFIREYDKRFDEKMELTNAILTEKNICLVRYFPNELILGTFRKGCNYIKKRI